MAKLSDALYHASFVWAPPWARPVPSPPSRPRISTVSVNLTVPVQKWPWRSRLHGSLDLRGVREQISGGNRGSGLNSSAISAWGPDVRKDPKAVAALCALRAQRATHNHFVRVLRILTAVPLTSAQHRLRDLDGRDVTRGRVGAARKGAWLLPRIPWNPLPPRACLPQP